MKQYGVFVSEDVLLAKKARREHAGEDLSNKLPFNRQHDDGSVHTEWWTAEEILDYTIKMNAKDQSDRRALYVVLALVGALALWLTRCSS
jgi:hypothetical protein